MMRFVGIDIGAERHMVAVLDEQGGSYVAPVRSVKTLLDMHDCSSCWAHLLTVS